jgi:hypothetical protein
VKTHAIPHPPVQQMHVVMARVYSSGIVVLTSECKFFAVTDLADPRPRKMADILGMMGRPRRRTC